MSFKNYTWNLPIWCVKSSPLPLPQAPEDRQPLKQYPRKAGGWTPKHSGNPFQESVVFKAGFAESKGFGGGWNGLGRAEVKIQVQSYHMPKQREKPHGILPTAPKGKLSCLGNNPWGLRPASVQAEHPAVSMVTLHPGKCGSPPIAQVLSDLVRIIFFTAPRKVNHPGRERDLCYWAFPREGTEWTFPNRIV